MLRIQLKEINPGFSMTGQRYKRTNFDDDDTFSNGPSTPPGIDFTGVMFKGGFTAWQKKTRLEKVLIVLLVALTLTVVVLAALLATKQGQVNTVVQKQQQQQRNQTEYCLTPACVTVASSVLNAMDRSVDPCTDFYQYSCGGWIRSHPIPTGHSIWSSFGVLWEENQVVMKNAIEMPLNMSKNKAEEKAKLYYKSCMDKNETVEKLGAQPLLDVLDTFGGWNISSKSGVFDLSSWDFQQTLQNVYLLNLNAFFSMWVGEDDKNSSRHILQLDQGGISLPDREYYLNKSITTDKVLSAYLKYMTEVGVLLGGDINETEDQMREVIELETKMAEINVPSDQRRDEEKLYHKMTIAQIQEMAPFIDWLMFFNALLNGTTNITVNAQQEVVVLAPGFLKNLTIILQQMLHGTEQDKNTLHNYLMWQVVRPLSTYLSLPFRTARKAFTKVISGSSGVEDLWRYCVTDTDSVLGFALGAMFVREAFHGDSKIKAEEMTKEVKTAFKKNLPNLSWMDDQTRKAAIEKANAVVDMIGFPQYILNSTRIQNMYKELEIKEDEYFLNNIRNLKFSLASNMKQLTKKPDRTKWSMTPPTVNAYYTPSKNEIVFPAGILQAPFYDRSYPKSLNFGAMGVVIGHELTHGFDDQGREFDKNGNLHPWWNNASIAKFTKRVQCMVKQYSEYTINGEHVNGKQTLGENIADNGGLKASFNAYQDWLTDHGAERPLPALNLTSEQLFFLGFSQVWCSSATKQISHLELLSDPHSPAKFRVIGTLSNSRDFAESFNCPVNSEMNPSHKCEVW